MGIKEAWNSTCKILLGEEIGDLEKYEKYLMQYIKPLGKEKSFLSEKHVLISENTFCKNSKFISNDEREKAQKLLKETQLDINQVKDIDSIIQALQEAFFYSGNVILGNSHDVQHSNNCLNSVFISNSQHITNSEYIAYSSLIRRSKFIFGSYSIADSNFAIGVFNGTKYARCFELDNCRDTSDSFYCANMAGCQDCMFSFNQMSKRCIIGNLQLEKSKYLELKKKIVEDIRTTLQSKKSIPRIVDILGSNGSRKIQKEKSTQDRFVESAEFLPIETAFQKTTSVLFGKSLKNLDAYAVWLQQGIPEVRIGRSALSGKRICIPAWDHYTCMNQFITKEEEMELANKSVDMKSLEHISLANAAELLKGINYTACEVFLNSVNCMDSAIVRESANCFHGSIFILNKCCAHSFIPRESEYVFGSNLLYSSVFCIRCFNSSKLARCFEVSDSNNCSDCYFCHNCENLQECIFCFNAKSLRYAIGNKEIGRENYMRIKKLVLEEIARKLENEKRLDLTIYDLGCKKKN